MEHGLDVAVSRDGRQLLAKGKQGKLVCVAATQWLRDGLGRSLGRSLIHQCTRMVPNGHNTALKRVAKATARNVRIKKAIMMGGDTKK